MKRSWIAGIVCAALLQAGPAPLRAQDLGGNERIIPLLEILARTSGASTDEVRAAIRDLLDLKIQTASGASLLLDRANVRFEPDPEVRAEAVAAFAACCPGRDLENRMIALRVARIAAAGTEPDPKVRIGALAALARFRCGEASARIQDSALEAGEPDPAVRNVARKLLAGGRATP